MSIMMALGLAGTMICLGMFCRAKIPFLRNMLVPSSVVAGVLGFILMNVLAAIPVELAQAGGGEAAATNFLQYVFRVSSNEFTEIVSHVIN